MRLAKYLAHAGVASRRAAELLIRERRVAVGGEVVTDPARDVSDGDLVELDGRALGEAEERVVYAVNKPRGVISTARDSHGRPTVVALLGDERGRLYPVGRLDADSSGLILVTNDGELANLLTHPRYEVPRTYHARVGGGRVDEEALRALRGGVRLEEGVTAPARVRRLRRSAAAGAGPTGKRPAARSTARMRASRGESEAEIIELTIHEGRNRQVRRMCEAVGHPVLALERVAFGPLTLNGLPTGAHRKLRAAEVRSLRAAAAPEQERA